MKPVLDTLTRLRGRRRDYELVFGTPSGQRVLQDLHRFCRMSQPCFVPGDPHATAYFEGMRRVFLRVTGILRWDEEQLLKLAEIDDDE